jgi:methionyl-tRNA formyltransferase
MTRLVFMGTPEFAVPALEKLAGGPYAIVGVYTQPDRPAGRGRVEVASPVKRFAVAWGLPVFQPESLKDPDELARLQALRPAVIVVAAYGQILRRAVLDSPPHAAINVHASYLPRWRGASPINHAILAGDAESGVTVMLMTMKVDAGDILAQRAEPIRPDDTAATLSDRLATLGAELLADTLPRWLAGAIDPIPQDESRATYAPLIKKEDGRIDWAQPAAMIERQVRAFQPWPGAFTHWDGRLLKILAAEVVAGDRPSGLVGPDLTIGTGEGGLRVTQLQPEGKRAMGAKEFLAGNRAIVGATLGPPPAEA